VATSSNQFRATFEGEGVSAEIGGRRAAPGAYRRRHRLTAGGGSLGSAAARAPPPRKPHRNPTRSSRTTPPKAFTFVRGKGKVLYVDNVEAGAGSSCARRWSGKASTLEGRHRRPGADDPASNCSITTR
jgi:hypothetical protein